MGLLPLSRRRIRRPKRARERERKGLRMILSHEKLDAYQVAIQFLAWSTEILQSLPRGPSSLADQLERAALCYGSGGLS
jgi:hypothetical protein